VLVSAPTGRPPVIIDQEEEEEEDGHDDDDDDEDWVPTFGVVCNSGDCTIKNVSCRVSQNARDEYRYLVECIRVDTVIDSTATGDGAKFVQIIGGEIVDPYIEHGIVIKSVYNDTTATTTTTTVDDDDGTIWTTNKVSHTMVSIQDVQIKNQDADGILVLGGVRSIRISNCTISNNGEDGIEIRRGRGIEFLAVMGSTINNNGDDGLDVDQSYYGDSDDVTTTAIVEVLIVDTDLVGNEEDGIVVQNADKVILDQVVTKGNGRSGLDVKRVNNIDLQGVVVADNFETGFSVSAKDANVTVTDCIFTSNGQEAFEEGRTERSGVHLWLSNRATFSNSISSENRMDGFSIWSVKLLNMTNVDSVNNGNNGFQIKKEADDEYDPELDVGSFVSEVVFTDVRACSNSNGGMEFFAEKDSWDGQGNGNIQFTPISGVISCQNNQSYQHDLEIHGGGKFAFISSSKIVADFCLEDEEYGCRDASRFERCNDDVCQPRDIITSNGDLLA
jgi:hypothetical protein